MDQNRAEHAKSLLEKRDIDLIVRSGTNWRTYAGLKRFLETLLYESRYSDHPSDKNIKIIDLCSGSGVYGIALADVLNVDAEIHFVDIVGDYHPVAQTLVKDVLGEKASAVTHTCSADNTGLSADTFDICIEADGFHHCPSVEKAITEAIRVLKPGGLFIGIDRIHRNSIKDSKIKELLDIKYPSDWLAENNYSVDSLSRGENGENEIRLKEWTSPFRKLKIKITFIEFIRSGSASFKMWILSNFPWILLLKNNAYGGWVIPPRWPISLLPALLFKLRSSIRFSHLNYIVRPFDKSHDTKMKRCQVVLARK